MKAFLCVVLLSVLFSGLLNAEETASLAGQWTGKLGAPEGGLRIVFHLTEEKDGSMTARMDSPDQGTFAILVSKVEHEGDRWMFRVDAVHGKYEGIENESGQIQGTWSQGRQTLSLNLTRDGQKLEGTIALPSQNLTIVFRINRDEDGRYSAKMDSPDQGATGIPVDSVERKDDVITLKVKTVGGTFTGTVKDGAIEGKWQQAGVSFPLTLSRSDD